MMKNEGRRRILFDFRHSTCVRPGRNTYHVSAPDTREGLSRVESDHCLPPDQESIEREARFAIVVTFSSLEKVDRTSSFALISTHGKEE